MVINRCKHDGDFFLTYIGLESVYNWRCVRCACFKLNFSPSEAGKIRNVPYIPDADGSYHPFWKHQLVAYSVTKKDNPGPKLSDYRS